MTYARQHAIEISSSMAGLPVCRVARGHGRMMTLDLGAWSDKSSRGERSLWMSGAIWRLDLDDKIAVDIVTSTDDEIDQALQGIEGDIVRDVAILDNSEIVVSSDGWSLIGFPIKTAHGNWVLFDETDATAYCDSNGELRTERTDPAVDGS